MESNITIANENASGVDLFFRKQVLANLAAIRGARILVIDPAGQLEVGEGEFEATMQTTLSVNDLRFYRRLALGGSIGAAESYMDGDWDVTDLTTLVRILVRNRDLLDDMEGGKLNIVSLLRKGWHYFNRNTESGSKKNIGAHYDLSNDFFKLFLDESLMYSSAIFSDRYESLEEASERKLKTICEKLQLKPSDSVIEIGTGWGGFAIYAAKNYGCHVTTTTISEKQYQEAEKRVQAAGLEKNITLLKQDYRHLSGNFDKLVSIEMVEAVGHQFLDSYFQKCSDLLKPSGVALIQAITLEDYRYEYSLKEVDFIKRYIFPGSFIPCVRVLTESAAKAELRNIGLRDIGTSYALTLRHWHERFLAQLPKVKALGFDDRFIRMWRFYLSYCEGGFWEGAISDVHLVFAKPQYTRENPSV